MSCPVDSRWLSCLTPPSRSLPLPSFASYAYPQLKTGTIPRAYAKGGNTLLAHLRGAAYDNLTQPVFSHTPGMLR